MHCSLDSFSSSGLLVAEEQIAAAALKTLVRNNFLFKLSQGI